MTVDLSKFPKGSIVKINPNNGVEYVEAPDTTQVQRDRFISQNKDLFEKRSPRRVVRPEEWIQPPDKS